MDHLDGLWRLLSTIEKRLLWDGLGGFWGDLEASFGGLGSLGAVWEALEAVLGWSWELLGRSWGGLGSSWGGLRASRGGPVEACRCSLIFD